MFGFRIANRFCPGGFIQPIWVGDCFLSNHCCTLKLELRAAGAFCLCRSLKKLVLYHERRVDTKSKAELKIAIRNSCQLHCLPLMAKVFCLSIFLNHFWPVQNITLEPLDQTVHIYSSNSFKISSFTFQVSLHCFQPKSYFVYAPSLTTPFLTHVLLSSYWTSLPVTCIFFRIHPCWSWLCSSVPSFGLQVLACLLGVHLLPVLGIPIWVTRFWKLVRWSCLVFEFLGYEYHQTLILLRC